jgi:hypothetical protein
MTPDFLAGAALGASLMLVAVVGGYATALFVLS